MKKKLIHKASVYAVLSAMVFGQCVNAYAAGPDSVTQGSWEYENQVWRHYSSSGQMNTGWICTSSGWYYSAPADGIMVTGWQMIDGKKYYFNTAQEGIEGLMHTGWLRDAQGNWYFLNTIHDGTYGSALLGWQWIDGYCYYFQPAEGENQGKMYAGQTTPDGCLTDAQGRWIENDGSIHYEAGKGISTALQSSAGSKSGGSSGSSSGGSSGSSSGGSSGGGSGSSGSTGNNGNAGNTGSTENDGNTGNTGSTGSNGNAGNTGSTGNDGNVGNTGSTGNNGTIGGESPDDPEPEQPTLLLNEQRTGLVDLGWAQYAVIAFQKGSIEDYEVQIDGTDITDACTRVDDDGTIVKWELTALNPGEVTAVRNSDGKTQTMTIGNGAGAGAVTAGDSQSSPAFILTNGPVSAFDYYLDVYDKDGNVRTEPAYTTFAVSRDRVNGAEEVPDAYYAPDALIDENGNGELQVKLSLDSEEQEKWFAGLKTVRAMDTDNRVLNGNLPFTASVETAYGKTGVIRIPMPQSNFYSRGRYQLNLISDYSSETKTMPVHIVDNRQFTMNLNALNTNIKTGECFAFTIVGPNGESFGTEILSPIYRVDLTMPSGKVKTLTEITDWYEIGDLLHICGTNTDGELITDESGVYTITVYADGYLTMTAKVEIAAARAGAIRARSYADLGIDALSSASMGGSSSGSGSDSESGGSTINAYLIFDHDLLANALILDEIGCENEDASAVVARWEDQTPLSVMGEDSEVLYDFVHYLNAVKNAKLNDGRYLSFVQYAAQGEGVTQNRPYQVKRVLEDGLLGSTFRFSDAVGKTAPKLSGTEGTLGQDLVLTCETDSEYISKITGMTLDGGALRSDDYLSHYLRSEDGSSLTIYSETKGTAGGSLLLTPGSHTLHIVAEGYQAADVILKIEKTLEQFDLSLNPNPEGEADSYIYYTGQDVSVSAACAEDEEAQADVRGDFMKNLTGISLKTPDGSTHKVTSSTEGQLGGDDNYIREDYSIILQGGLFKEAGEYEVTVSSEGYTPKLLTFTIEKAADISDDPGETKEAPEMEGAEYKDTMFDGKYYHVAFTGLETDELKDYLENKITSVAVNGEDYTKVSIFWNSEKSYKVKAEYGETKYLDFTADGFDEGENTITIEADGYETLEFTITTAADGTVTERPDGNIPDDNIPGEDDLLEAPEMKGAEYKDTMFDGKYYHVAFTGLETDELEDYLENKITSVAVNGEDYTKVSIFWNSEKSYKANAEYGETKYLDFTADGFEEGENTITIEADGYETLEFTITTAADGTVTERPDDNIPGEDDLLEAPEMEGAEYKDTMFDGKYYHVAFTGLETDELEDYLKNKITSVAVNGEDYTKVSIFWNSEKSYKVKAEYGETKYLDFTADGFEEGENTITIEADGYETLEFTIVTDETGEVIANNPLMISTYLVNLDELDMIDEDAAIEDVVIKDTVIEDIVIDDPQNSGGDDPADPIQDEEETGNSDNDISGAEDGEDTVTNGDGEDAVTGDNENEDILDEDTFDNDSDDKSNTDDTIIDGDTIIDRDTIVDGETIMDNDAAKNEPDIENEKGSAEDDLTENDSDEEDSDKNISGGNDSGMEDSAEDE